MEVKLRNYVPHKKAIEKSEIGDHAVTLLLLPANVYGVTVILVASYPGVS